MAATSITSTISAGLSTISAGLVKGNTGAAVKELQYQLYVMGYLSKSDAQGVNGINTFGSKTEAAVKDVQRKYNAANGKNIPVDGKVSLMTGRIIKQVVLNTPKQGSTGSLVEASSNYLIWAGLLSEAKTTLDAQMEGAINKFQSAHGLYQTGTLNTKTVTKLVAVQMDKIKSSQQKIIIKEVLTGEVNHETKPVFGTGTLLLGAGVWLMWWMNKKKVVVR